MVLYVKQLVLQNHMGNVLAGRSFNQTGNLALGIFEVDGIMEDSFVGLGTPFGVMESLVISSTGIQLLLNVPTHAVSGHRNRAPQAKKTNNVSLVGCSINSRV